MRESLRSVSVAPQAALISEPLPDQRHMMSLRGALPRPSETGERNGGPMVYYLIICRSLTYAQRTAQVLERVGISAYVQRAPKTVSKEGCGYCVRIPERRLTDALTILRREGMSPKQVFLQTAEGEYSEVKS